jgi:hypothetical protein
MRARHFALCLLAAGCGSLGAGPASDDVPNAGVTGWRKLASTPGSSIIEPWVFCPDSGARAPAALRDDTDYRLYYVTPAGAIGLAKGTGGIYDLADQGAVALPDPGPWDRVSVAHDGSQWLLAAGAADRSRISIFSSTDGASWTASTWITPDFPWEAGGVGSPALLRDPTGLWVLYFDGGQPAQAIGRATSPDAASFVPEPQPLFTVADARATGWPVTEIGEPGAGVDTSRPGPPVYKLWFSGRTVHGDFPFTSEWSIGFAGSFDGAAWSQYGLNPVLAQVTMDIGSLPTFTDERSPSVIAYPDGYRMYFEQPFEDFTSGLFRPCVALAQTP